ncbi:MAG: hypothetical protein HY647_08945 [Acidobacteria bacterium]|nr:hypothetical protein [Acidobacteriota bacterium]
MVQIKKAGLFVLVVGGVLILGSALARAGEMKTLEGTVSNTHCGLKHASPAADAATCVNGCVQNMGAKYALVVGDQVYELEGGTAELQKLAGGSAKVTGTVDGMKIKVSSVSAPGKG